MPVEASQLQPQSNQLVQRLSEWLKTPPTGSASSTIGVPPALPYLCDRIDQEAFFVDSYASETSPRMIACVIHGHRNESHTALLDRFLAAGLIDKVLRCQEEGARSVLLRPAPFKLKNAQFGDALKSAFKSAVMDKITATDAELRAYLSALPNPLVCEVQVTWSAFKEVGDQTIKGLIDAWMALPSVGGETSVRLPFSALLWVNLTYDDLETELAEPVLVKPLPKLPDLGEQEVLDWLRLTDVRKHASRKHNDLLKIVSMPEYLSSARARPHDAVRRSLSKDYLRPLKETSDRWPWTTRETPRTFRPTREPARANCPPIIIRPDMCLTPGWWMP